MYFFLNLFIKSTTLKSVKHSNEQKVTITNKKIKITKQT